MSERFDRQTVSGNVYDAVEKQRREIDRLQTRKLDSGALDQVLAWGDDVDSDGLTTLDHNTGNTYNAQIMPLVVRYPIRIINIFWDLRNSGTYALRWLWEPNANSPFETLYSAAFTVGSGTYSYTPSIPIVIMPGTHYFGVYTTPAVTWFDTNASAFLSADKAWAINGLYYNTTAFSYVPPVRITYQLGTWSTK